MAQVTYRGVSYDTEEYNNKVLAEAVKRQRHELMYRGVKVQRKMVKTMVETLQIVGIISFSCIAFLAMIYGEVRTTTEVVKC